MPIMHVSLQWLGLLRSFGLLPNLTIFISPLRWIANRLTPFGSDYGGMLVEVVGTSRQNSRLVAGTWRLCAQPGEGPFVPTIAARAILRNIHLIPSGARACIGELPLGHYVQAMDELGIDTSSHTQTFNYLFADMLGDHWHALPESQQNTHCVIDRKTLKGFAKITRGTSLITNLIAVIFRLPAAADKVSVEVVKTRFAESEVWERKFNGKKFKSTLSKVTAAPNQVSKPLMQEQFGLLKFTLGLNIDSKGLHFPVISGSCLGIPIPKVLLPARNTREFEKDGTMHFCVELLAPFKLGLIVRYEGWLT